MSALRVALCRKRRRPAAWRLFAAVGTVSSLPPAAAAGPLHLVMSVNHYASSATHTPAFTPAKFYYNDIYKVDLPPGHRFPMAKYKLAREEVQRRLEGTGLATFHPSPLASITDLETTHCGSYIRRFLDNRLTPSETRVVGFPWSEQSVARTLSSVGGTVAATHTLLAPYSERHTPHRTPGTHHAFYDRGEGFCYFSDIAVGVNVALRDYGRIVRKVLIIDLDVHQGNGNAALFQHDDRVYTLSVHCKGNYFSMKQDSDMDVELEVGDGDSTYLQALTSALPPLFTEVDPDLVLYQGGIDPLDEDRLGQLQLTRTGLRDRNALVYELCGRHGAPLVVTMGGGYPKDLNTESRSFRSIVDAHADVYVQAALAASTTHDT